MRPLPLTHRIASYRKMVKMKMKIYAVQESKGAQTRARNKLIEEEEKNNIFLNLEKAQSNVKIMDRI